LQLKTFTFILNQRISFITIIINSIILNRWYGKSRVQTLPKNGKACPVSKAFALLTEAIDHVLTCLIVFAFLFLALQSWFHQSRSTRYIRFNSIPFKLLFVLCRFCFVLFPIPRHKADNGWFTVTMSWYKMVHFFLKYNALVFISEGCETRKVRREK